jgi:hypothetical protein
MYCGPSSFVVVGLIVELVPEGREHLLQGVLVEQPGLGQPVESALRGLGVFGLQVVERRLDAFGLLALLGEFLGLAVQTAFHLLVGGLQGFVERGRIEVLPEVVGGSVVSGAALVDSVSGA